MRQSYEVVWAETAERDLQGIVSYIAQDSTSQALKVLLSSIGRCNTCLQYIGWSLKRQRFSRALI